jgi:hypothetical protein
MSKKVFARRGLNTGASKKVISWSGSLAVAPTGFASLFPKLGYV